jgi:hypothetical protein
VVYPIRILSHISSHLSDRIIFPIVSYRIVSYRIKYRILSYGTVTRFSLVLLRYPLGWWESTIHTCLTRLDRTKESNSPHLQAKFLFKSVLRVMGDSQDDQPEIHAENILKVLSFAPSGCLALSFRVVSCRVVSCLVLSCRVLSCLVVSYLVLSCRILSCRVLSLSCLIVVQ